MGGGICSVRSHDTAGPSSSSSSSSSSSETSARHRRATITAVPLLLLLLQTTASPASSFVIPSSASSSSFPRSPCSAFPSHQRRDFLSRWTTIKKTPAAITPAPTPAAVTALHVKNDRPTTSGGGGSGGGGTAAKKPKRKQSRSTTIPAIDEGSEKPADIAGAEFFGGRAVKEELFDPEEEERAALRIELEKRQSLKRRQAPSAPSSTAAETTDAVETKKEKPAGDDAAAADLAAASELLEYRRFDDKTVFPDELSRNLAMSLQREINSVLYLEDEEPTAGVDSTGGTSSSSGSTSLYDPDDMQWITPFPRSRSSSSKSTSTTPLEELANAVEFYNRIDIAVVAARTVADDDAATAGAGAAAGASSSSSAEGEEKRVEIKWEISLVWPNFWEGRVLLTGASVLSVRILDDDDDDDDDAADGNSAKIIEQIDRLDHGGGGGDDENDAWNAVGTQFLPRFWDAYHIGMTPPAEIMPRLDLPPPSSSSSSSSSSAGRKGPFSSYAVMELPPRLVLRPSILDRDGRDGRWAQAVPNHAFATVIKTTGPKRQRYVPTTPVEVGIARVRGGDDGDDGGERAGEESAAAAGVYPSRPSCCRMGSCRCRDRIARRIRLGNRNARTCIEGVGEWRRYLLGVIHRMRMCRTLENNCMSRWYGMDLGQNSMRMVGRSFSFGRTRRRHASPMVDLVWLFMNGGLSSSRAMKWGSN